MKESTGNHPSPGILHECHHTYCWDAD
jgi:hypothetical protein